MKKVKIITLIFSLIFINTIKSQTTNEVMVGKIQPGEIDMAGFRLSDKAEITVEGTGATFENWHDDLAFYGWIIETESREVVWHLGEYGDYDEDDGIFKFEDELQLDKGEYEVYYAGSPQVYYALKSNNFESFINKLFGRKKYKSSHKKKLFMTVSGPENGFEIVDPKKLVDELRRDAVVSFVRVGDFENKEKGFSLKAETELQIYAIGEGQNGNIYDVGWIYDVINNERVWMLKSKYADHAGGGDKNILVDEEITLPEGSYIVKYSSDDSHSFDEWNVPPPDDPQFWGITIWPVSESDLANVIDFKESDVVEPIVEINEVGDDKFLSQGFSLKKPVQLRVLCLGEGYTKKFSDHGWIINADTKETVWKMTGRRTEHAGGADKNRMLDEKITLEKGSYIAYYNTDDSHSYKDWNATPPFDKQRWGMTIWPSDKDDINFIELFNEEEYVNEDILVEIIRVKDKKEIKRSFEIAKDSRVRIIALGEGDKSGMYDFGLIEDNKGKVVWEMTYRRTDHAGGARKNRYFNDTILLESGKYWVFYETDGSHSYNRWNSTSPDNPEMYGITILLED
ncbi:hypothetical protein ACFLS9_00170 [Bacteroidota bacterium]